MTANPSPMSCECGCGRIATETLENEQPGQPYRLCSPCAARLESRSLRPVEWFHLASIHSPWKHLVHDDFYTEDGNAEQPEEDVSIEPSLMRAPTFESCAEDVEKLLPYAFTRHFLELQTIRALRTMPATEVFETLQTCLRVRTPNSHNMYVAYCVVSEVVGPIAADFVRRACVTCTDREFPGVVRAVAGCLPRDEGLAWALEYLDDLDRVGRVILKDSLTLFADARILDWIERHVDEIDRAAAWQGLAAFSGFSWERARAWLRSRRPLSLVALGAIRAGYGLTGERSASGETPLPISFPSVNEVHEELDAVLAWDNTPNARNQVQSIRALLTPPNF